MKGKLLETNENNDIHDYDCDDDDHDNNDGSQSNDNDHNDIDNVNNNEILFFTVIWKYLLDKIIQKVYKVLLTSSLY